MESKTARTLYFLLFCLGWIGIFWVVYAFLMNAYNGTPEILSETPSFLILLCVSFMSIATAFILEQTSQAKQ